MADIFSSLAGAGVGVDPSTLVHLGGSLFSVVQNQRKKAKGPSSGHNCDGPCKKEIYAKADRYRCAFALPLPYPVNL